VDSTSATSAPAFGVGPTVNTASPSIAEYRGYPGIGFHYLQWLEISQTSGTSTWYGNATIGTILQSGMIAEVQA
jgi:hypothetical protein